MKRPSIASIAKPLGGLAACVAGILASGPSMAHDELYGWRGFYVGASGTYSFTNQDIKFNTPVVASGSADLGGIAGTGMLGYRIPAWSNAYRVGFEVDATIGDNRGAFNRYRFTQDFLATARGTFGIHVRPDLLWFATGGFGWMGINSAPSSTRASLLGGGNVLIDQRMSKTVFGGVVGTGLEWDMNKAIHLRGEYLYGAFENHRAESNVADKTVSTDTHQIRLGVVVSLQNPYDEPHGVDGRHGGDIDHDRYTRGPMK
jgi:opacity protein-like surface antigen